MTEKSKEQEKVLAPIEVVDYKTMKEKVFAEGTAADGYFGDRRQVQFALFYNRIYVVTDCGYFWSGLCEDSVKSAIWILKNHPSAGQYTITTRNQTH